GPVQSPAGRMAFELMLEIVELVANRARLVTQHLLDGGRKTILVAHHRDRRNIPDHRGEHDAYPGLAIRRDDDVGLFVGERRKPEHVLDGGDAAPEALQRAYQSACAHFVLAAVGSHRQGVEQPYFQRQLLEQAAAQHIVRMIVRIDEPGHDQPSGCIDDFVHGVGGKSGTDRKYLVVFDQDVGERRLMDIALVVVDLAASDQRSFRRHLSSILRSSAPYQRQRCRFRSIALELLYCLAVLVLRTTSECCYRPENSLTIPCGVWLTVTNGKVRHRSLGPAQGG